MIPSCIYSKLSRGKVMLSIF